MTRRRKRYQRFVLREQLILAAVLSCVLFAPSLSFSECTTNHEDLCSLELLAMGKRGETIARAREQVLEILQSGNACSAWFQEADPDPAGVFRSVHFELEEDGTSYAYGMRVMGQRELFKQPWGARTTENGGRNSIIQLNGNGAFFNHTSRIIQLGPGGNFAGPGGQLMLTISSYNGNTREAQITILLHELGHIIGRLPLDDDSWDGRSLRNTSEVHTHCKTETRAAAHSCPRGSHNPGVQPGNENFQAQGKRPRKRQQSLPGLSPQESSNFRGHQRRASRHENSRESQSQGELQWLWTWTNLIGSWGNSSGILGAQSGEKRIREVVTAAGFDHIRREAEIPLTLSKKLVLEPFRLSRETPKLNLVLARRHSSFRAGSQTRDGLVRSTLVEGNPEVISLLPPG